MHHVHRVSHVFGAMLAVARCTLRSLTVAIAHPRSLVRRPPTIARPPSPQAILDTPLKRPLTAPQRNASRRIEPPVAPPAVDGAEDGAGAPPPDLPKWIHPKNAGVEEEESRGFCWQM